MSFFASAEAAADAYADAILESAVEERDGEVFLESGRLFQGCAVGVCAVPLPRQIRFQQLRDNIPDRLAEKRQDDIRQAFRLAPLYASDHRFRSCRKEMARLWLLLSGMPGAADIFTVVRMPDITGATGRTFRSRLSTETP